MPCPGMGPALTRGETVRECCPESEPSRPESHSFLTSLAFGRALTRRLVVAVCAAFTEDATINDLLHRTAIGRTLGRPRQDREPLGMMQLPVPISQLPPAQ